MSITREEFEKEKEGPIKNFLRENKDEAFSVKEITEQVDRSYSTVRDRLIELENEGVAESTTSGYSKMYIWVEEND